MTLARGHDLSGCRARGSSDPPAAVLARMLGIHITVIDLDVVITIGLDDCDHGNRSYPRRSAPGPPDGR
jgi:hypothetical protein